MIDSQEILKVTHTLKVLYVEDNDNIREQTLLLLQNYFTNIDVAEDGILGLELFHSNTYQVIFTDLDMPNLDGISMIEAIRKDDLNIPIVVLSSYEDKEYFLETIKFGIDGYILKPYDFNQFLETINKIILKLELKIETEDFVKLDFNFTWDKKNQNLLNNGEIFKLTKNEKKLMDLFINNENQIIGYENIESSIFSDKGKENTNTRNLISRLKTKLGVNLIESHYGLGYILRKKIN